ncbi:hypothetical protein PN419_00190 [Halorubrum ezzemoulense]|uniref:hypothetical protein n=1 Tax=Halorubrum ezzemoulense TaxID=337243 RepID=UPI00232E523E|nr:hypothetical protein [Halorubrum ezzemoulense]MDB9247425.1 hypothetical protein [Halorubrum ezzemoulense]MDB9258666.1 hypothetical protein [Halorubrum ezzemoulense]MDB9264476.1 hypothetical protein [Halorubrum ezzemoulense]MDB9269027.1 hypothetical protein [Halorubrum ezzemoulense]MDB9271444.1 hypothetical protein [Halorubrum ezzemoulense]
MTDAEYTFTEDELRALLTEMAAAAYRGARYRGQFRASGLDDIQKKVVERKADEWWRKHRDEYVSESDGGETDA